MEQKDSLFRRGGVNYLLPFIIITSCFALWGFANDITNPMVKAFSKIFRMSVTEGSLVQVAFYGGYFAMALPAAIFIRRYSYKAGVLMGLGLYAAGAALFFPAKMIGSYYPFLAAYFILTCGLSFLETSCNPYILTMGSEETATRRLNFAQCFNPCGSILGMFVAMNFIQNRLDPRDTEARAMLDDSSFETLKQSDLGVLIAPYLVIVAVIVALFLVILFMRVPKTGESGKSLDLAPTFRRLLRNVSYREGVIAQFFYVAVQIMCWTFIIQYGTNILRGEVPTGFERSLLSWLGTVPGDVLTEKAAEVLSQGYNIIAMALFICSRFICTYFLKYVSPGRLLAVLAIAGGLLTLGVISFTTRAGLYCLVGVSGCMSLMFPTIYGIALKGMGDDAKFGAAGLIMAILGGSVFPPVQATVIDSGISVCGIPSVNLSFAIPLLCFAVVAAYGYRTGKLRK